MSAPSRLQVSAIRIVDFARGSVATLTERGWMDPWGVLFEAADQAVLDGIARQPDGMRAIVRGAEVIKPKVYVTR